MQSKGFIKLIAVLLALACVYQLSFTFKTRGVEKQAAAYAAQFPLDQQGEAEQHYLDSVQNLPVYNLGFRKFTYKECKEKELNLGLDLKGGMNVMLEVQVEDVVKALAGDSQNDPAFIEAIGVANEAMKQGSSTDYISDFVKAYSRLSNGRPIAELFVSPDRKDITLESSDADVEKILKKETEAAIGASFNVLRSRIDHFGVTQPNILRLPNSHRILVELPGVKEPQRVRDLLQGTASLEFWTTYDANEIFPALSAADKLIKAELAQAPAAAPETAAAEAAGELVIATRETANVTDPVEEYNAKNLHRFDMTYPLDASDFGKDDYRVYVADTDNLRGSELRGALIERLYTSGVRVVAVPDGAAAGVLLDNYLQTGNTESLDSYLAVLPADDRDSARTLWEGIYRSYPGVFHAAGLGADARSATVGKALSVLANASYNYPETEIAEAVKALRSGTTADAVYWFKSAMASYPRQMERFFGDRYAAAARLYYAMQGTLNVADDSELPLYDAKQLLKTYKNDAILIFTDEASAVQTEGSLAAELQAQLDKQKYDEGEDHDKVCAIATIYGTWSNAGNFTPDDAETAWDADSLTEYLGSDALRGKDMVLALDGEDSPYLTRQCLLKDAGAPVGELVQKLFVLDKNNMASPETAQAE